MSEPSPRRIGRVLALVSLTLIVTGVIAQGLISNRLIVFADAAATARNILANIGLFRLGFTIFVIEMVAQVATTALWYSLLRAVKRAHCFERSVHLSCRWCNENLRARLLHRSGLAACAA